MALLKVNGADMPAPLTIQPSILDLDSEEGTGRNQAGDAFRDRIAVKRTLEVSWGPLTKTEMSLLLKAISPQTFELTYPDPQEGDFKTITAKSGDRTVPLLVDLGNDDWMWGSFSVKFTEM